MTIYEPVTDIGKAIAKALTKDDGIRLDVHDILEKWERSLKNVEEHPHHYNPEEAIRIVESTYPLLFSGRYVLSNMRQMKEKAKNLEDVKKQLVEFPCINVQDYQRMMRKIKKILEAKVQDIAPLQDEDAEHHQYLEREEERQEEPEGS